ncbi:MAG TPA: DUF2252 domain-containing protein [Methylomirabilota bacterium]|nr:DUF2252 domain-containing protein [Methylomirabilota bacterium]
MNSVSQMKAKRGSNTKGHRRIARLTESFVAPRLSVEERIAVGKTLRAKVPRSRHAELTLASNRDPIGIILEQAKSRIKELVPIRHARMLASPFAFLRGAAAVMAADLAPTPSTGLRVQACGDMHVSNFGVFASAERNVVFSINDFDETQPGPWEWDLKRLASSAYVAARFIGAGRSDREAAARATAASYRRWMRKYAWMGNLATWYATIDMDDVFRALSSDARARAKAILAKAQKRNHLQVLDKMTDLIDDQRRIIEQRPFVVRTTHTWKGRPVEEALGLFLEAYLDSLPHDRRQLLERYRIIDVAHKIVGVGSVGTRCWVILLRGAGEDDPLFLQVKEAQPSVLARYFPVKPAYSNHGHRVVVGQHLIQGSPDIFLGWGEVDGVHFYVRQLRDMKGGTEIEPGKSKPANLIEYCGLCGWALALAHAKSGDAAAISGYIGKSDALEDALATFAARYADVTERDHAAMAKQARAGRIKVAAKKA